MFRCSHRGYQVADVDRLCPLITIAAGVDERLSYPDTIIRKLGAHCMVPAWPSDAGYL
jgi:hypothetical protein